VSLDSIDEVSIRKRLLAKPLFELAAKGVFTPIINHHFSHVHASFWRGEQCSSRCQQLVPDETDGRFGWQTSQKSEPNFSSRFMAPDSIARVSLSYRD